MQYEFDRHLLSGGGISSQLHLSVRAEPDGDVPIIESPQELVLLLLHSL